jgi:hypothetical protein
MSDLIRNSQLYGFNNSSFGKICVAKCEEEKSGQIIIIQGIAMKTCVLFNIINHRQENKTETSKPNLTNFDSLFSSKSGRIGSFY